MKLRDQQLTARVDYRKPFTITDGFFFYEVQPMLITSLGGTINAYLPAPVPAQQIARDANGAAIMGADKRPVLVDVFTEEDSTKQMSHAMLSGVFTFWLIMVGCPDVTFDTPVPAELKKFVLPNGRLNPKAVISHKLRDIILGWLIDLRDEIAR
jgi:hypothetical protein